MEPVGQGRENALVTAIGRCDRHSREQTGQAFDGPFHSRQNPACSVVNGDGQPRLAHRHE